MRHRWMQLESSRTLLYICSDVSVLTIRLHACSFSSRSRSGRRISESGYRNIAVVLAARVSGVSGNSVVCMFWGVCSIVPHLPWVVDFAGRS